MRRGVVRFRGVGKVHRTPLRVQRGNGRDHVRETRRAEPTRHHRARNSGRLRSPHQKRFGVPESPEQGRNRNTAELVYGFAD